MRFLKTGQNLWVHEWIFPMKDKGKDFPHITILDGCQRIKWKKLFSLSRSGQIIIFHQPRFPWNKGNSLTKPQFGVRSCEVAIIIWPGRWRLYPNIVGWRRWITRQGWIEDRFFGGSQAVGWWFFPGKTGCKPTMLNEYIPRLMKRYSEISR